MVRRKIAKLKGGNAVLYVRVSSAQQAEEGLSLEAQQARLETYCQLHGLKVVRVVVDPAQSAFKPLDKRKGGREVLELVDSGAVQAVVVFKLDRAFRNTADCLATVGKWDQLGVSLHLVDMGGASIDTSTAVGKMFLTMLAGFAEFERNQTAERTAMALAHKAARGERIGGDAPFGYAHLDGKLVANETEQAVIARVRQLRADGVSLRGVGDALDAAGVTNRAGGRFAPEQIVRMLAGPKRKVAAA